MRVRIGGGGTAAAVLRQKKQMAKEAAAAAADAKADKGKSVEAFEDEEELEETRAQRIVKTLYGRYEKQMQRWGHYNTLFAFLGFVGLLLMVLYLQRVSDISYKVHDTVWAVVQPSAMTYQSKDDVYAWMQNLLATVWADPVCGDGLCEVPFEYPSYGRFGCRADCGQMVDKFNLTSIQIDINFDFNHPVGSLPASDLMSQATWNLCPTASTFAQDCYYDTPNTFTQLKGTFTTTITDAPDGDWSIQVTNDLFNKVSGAVRNVTALNTAAFFQKVYIAYTAAKVDRAWERGILNNVTSNWTALIATAPYDDLTAQLVTQRLGDGKLTGKSVQRGSAIAQANTYVTATYPELANYIFNFPIGQDPVNSPLQCRVADLAAYYVLGSTFYVAPQPGFNLLTASKIATYINDNTSATYNLDNILGFITTRLAELDAIDANVDAISMATPLGTYTVAQIVAAWTANGATNVLYPAAAIVLPSSQDAGLAPFTTVYDLTTWTGGISAYLTCGVPDITSRIQEYAGSCYTIADPTAQPINSILPVNKCASNVGNDTYPYECTTMAGVLAHGITTGNGVADLNYRLQCELPCDMIADCNAMCVCEPACATDGTQYCLCSKCNSLVGDALKDADFLEISAQYAGAGGTIATTTVGSGRRRKLMDATSDALNLIAVNVDQLRTTQSALQSQIQTLATNVDTANMYAKVRANDNTLINLVSAAKTDLTAGQVALNDKLDVIIGKQSQALALAQAAAASLAALTTMATTQVAALQSLAAAVQAQLVAIKTATSQGVITLSQALSLYKRARRDQAVNLRTFVLANLPCSPNSPQTSNDFAIRNNNTLPDTTSRERTIGLNNRVVAGMMVHTTRRKETRCPTSKFDVIQSSCTGAPDLSAYGVDPIFRLGSVLYNPNLNDADNTIVTQYYNCSQLPRATYNYFDAIQNRTVNEAPYCTELFKTTNVPYAFHRFNLDGYSNGFPFFYDINLDQNTAQSWHSYMTEGLYLDPHTEGMTVKLVTYNAELRVFANIFFQFTFGEGGSIAVKYSLYTLRVEMYSTPEDGARFALEVILTMIILLMFGWQVFVVARLQRRTGNGLRYFTSAGIVLDFISNTIMFACMCIWWDRVYTQARGFDIKLRYNVYDDLGAEAYFVKLRDNGVHMTELNEAFQKLDSLVEQLNWYYALHGINILLLIARVLKRMDFQPRLGVVTRSLALAGPDLAHFALVAGVVFIGYAMMAHLIFGNSIAAYATFNEAVNTNFIILLGSIDVNEELRMLPGLQGVAGTLFFWTYELLVFMVLLNFLLAIIVDAFSEVKEQTHETTSIHTEVGQLLTDRWRALVGRITNSYIPDSKLRILLRSWAGQTEAEEADAKLAAEMELEEEGKVLKILGEQLDEDTLREVLLACLAEAPLQGGKAPKVEGLLPSLFRRRPVVAGEVATDEDVALASKYILERFGISAADLAAKEEEGGGGGGDDEEGAAEQAEEARANEAALEQERNQLAAALERLANVQHELAEGQRNLMAGQKRLAEQQAKLVSLMKQ